MEAYSLLILAICVVLVVAWDLAALRLARREEPEDDDAQAANVSAEADAAGAARPRRFRR